MADYAGTPTFHATIPLPTDDVELNAARINGMTQLLQDDVIYLATVINNGVPNVRTVTDLAGMAALTSVTAYATCIVVGNGVYYAIGSLPNGVGADQIYVVTSIGTPGIYWIHGEFFRLQAASGFAMLDSGLKLPSANTHFVTIEQDNLASSGGIVDGSLAPGQTATLPHSSVSFAAARIHDRFELNFLLLVANSTAPSYLSVFTSENGDAEQQQMLFTVPVSMSGPYAFSYMHEVSVAGTLEVHLKATNGAGSGYLTATAANNSRFGTYRWSRP